MFSLVQEISEKVGLAERKCVLLQADLEDHQALLDKAERAVKMNNAELAEARDRLEEMSCSYAKELADKRQLESGIQSRHAELDDLVRQVKHAEEKAKMAIADAGRIADELRN